MDVNCFCRVFKYTESKEISPIENFTTEMFVFVWNYLIETRPDLAKKLFALFDIPVEDLTKVHIDTQKVFYVHDNVKVIPDITIYTNENEFYFIEVKVEQPLNKYKLKSGKCINCIDQVDLYTKIDNCKAVYTLTKHFVDKENFKNKIRWFQIYGLLKIDKSMPVLNFLRFLEENDMGEKKAITKNAVDILGNIRSILDLIKIAWENLEFDDRYSKLSSCNIDLAGIGYEVCIKDFTFWIGILPDEKFKNKIVLWIQKDSEGEIPEKKLISASDNSNFVFSETLNLSDLIAEHDFAGQEKLAMNWLKELESIIFKNI